MKNLYFLSLQRYASMLQLNLQSIISDVHFRSAPTNLTLNDLLVLLLGNCRSDNRYGRTLTHVSDRESYSMWAIRKFPTNYAIIRTSTYFSHSSFSAAVCLLSIYTSFRLYIKLLLWYLAIKIVILYINVNITKI